MRPRAAGITVKHSVARLLFGNVTVATNNDGESGGFGFEVQLRQIVQHIDGNATQFKHFGFRQLVRPRSFVDVAAHGYKRGDGGEFFKDLGRAYIPGMNDVFGSALGFEGLRTQQAVRIGDDADQDRQFSVLSSQFSVLSSQFLVLGSWYWYLVLSYFTFIFSTNFPMLTTARATVPRPISWTSSRAVTRNV